MLQCRGVDGGQVGADHVLDEWGHLCVVDVAIEAARFRDTVGVVGDVDAGVYLCRSGLGVGICEGLAIDDRTQIFSVADQASMRSEADAGVDESVLTAL